MDPTFTLFAGEDKKNVPPLHEEYDRRLHQPWPKRGRGVPHDWILAPIFLFTFPGLVGIFIFFHDVFPGIHRWDFSLTAQISGLIVGSAFLFAWIVWLPNQIYNTNILTVRHSFRLFPALRGVIRSLVESNDRFRRHLPVLNIEGRKYFLVSYCRRNDRAYQKRSGMVLVNEKMQIVENDPLFEKAILTEDIAFICAHQERNKDLQWPRNHKIVLKALQKAERELRPQNREFEKYGYLPLWQMIMDGIKMLPEAKTESGGIIHTAHEEIRKAYGYSFAVEFYYEDGLRLHELRQAYYQYMWAAYGNQLQKIKNAAIMLTELVQKTPGWPHRKAVLEALAQTGIIAEGILIVMDRFKQTGRVTPEERVQYHHKITLARERRITVVGE